MHVAFNNSISIAITLNVLCAPDGCCAFEERFGEAHSIIFLLRDFPRVCRLLGEGGAILNSH